MVPAGRAKLLQLHPILVLLLVLGSRVVAILTVAALQCDDFTHWFVLALSRQFSAFSEEFLLAVER
jgi:hypothetical protein